MAAKQPPFGLRLPPNLKAWVEKESEKNKSSQNSEIVRAVRERAERQEETNAAK